MEKMMRKSKRFLAFLLVFAMLFQQTALISLAEETEITTEAQGGSVQQPESKAPETTAPETTAPETKEPETTAPETTAPETKEPETTAPETTAPETKEPETTPPETGAADKTTQTNAPETEIEKNGLGGGTEQENIVTFRVPETVVVKVNEKEVTDGTALTKDGKIVFTVQAKDGYEVTEVLVDETVPARRTENENEYIIEGIQTDATVVTVKVKEAECETEETEAAEPENIEAEETEAAGVPARKMMRSMIMRAPEETVPVVLRKLTKEGSVDTTVQVNTTIVVGNFTETATQTLLEGHEDEFPAGLNYTFAYALVNNVKITSVAVEVDEDGKKTTYVSIGNDGYSDMELSGSSVIELFYQETPGQYNIYCGYTLEDYTIENPDIKPMIFSLNDVEGKIEQGKDVVINTLYTAGFGFLDISKVEYTVNNVKKELSITQGQSTFTIPKEDIQGDVDVNFTLKKHEQTYNVSFMGANSHWTSGDWKWNNSQGEYSKGSTLNMGTYDLSGDGKKSLTFTFNAYQQWGDQSVSAPGSYADYSCPAKSLNKIVLSIGKGSNKFAVEDRYITLPEAREGATATTSLRNGATVTVKCIREGFAQGDYDDDKNARLNEANLPEYEVTITAGEGRILYGDIEVETNFKDSTTWEIWVTELTGMECLKVDDSGGIINASNNPEHGYVNYDGYPYNDLRPKNGVYYQRTPGQERTLRGDILPGYSINRADYEVFIVLDNVQQPALSTNEFQIEKNADGQWQFIYTITDTVSTDFRISVSTKYNNFKTFYTEDQTVTADNYQDNKDKFAVNTNDPGKYGHFETDNTGKVVFNVGNYIPEKEGYVFDYWEAIFSGDKFYPGATVNVNSADHSLLDDIRRFNAETNGYEFYLRAHFVEKPESEMTDYNIKLTFAGVQGEFEIPDQGVKNTTAKVKEQKLKAYINEHYSEMGLPANWEDFFTWDSKKTGNSGIGVIQGDHSTVIPVAFDIKPLVIAGKSDTLEYNGTEQSVTGFATEEDGKGVVTINGHKYYVEGLTHTASGTDVSGSPYNGTTTGKAKITDELGADVTSYFDGVTVTPGTLTITAKAVTIKVKSASKYVGEADPTFDGTVEGLIGSDQIGTVTYSRTNTNVETVGIYSKVITANVTDANPNYTVTVEPGDFEIKAGRGDLKVTKTTTSTPKDGKAYTAGETITYSITVKNTGNVTLKDVVVKDTLTNGDNPVGTINELAPNEVSSAYTVSHVVTGAEAKAGKVTNVATAEGTTPSEDKVRGSGQKEDSAAQIPVKITVHDASKVYGTADPAFSGTITGLQDNDSLDVSYSRTGSDENVGIYSNVLTAAYTNNDKYEVTVVPGTFTITTQRITPGPDPDNPDSSYLGIEVGNPQNTVYNGKEQKQPLAVTDKDGKTLTENTDYTLAYTAAVDVGTVTVTVTGSGNYTGTVTRTYEITPAPLTISTETATKKYDGNPLTAPGEVKGLVNGEEVDFKTTGSQTYVGNSSNKYELNWTKTAKKSNYEIKNVTLGTLTVTDGDSSPVTKTHEDKTYQAKETITFTIKVTNPYAEEKTITLTEQDGVELSGATDGKLVFNNVAPGNTVTATAAYEVTEDDVKTGRFTNKVTADFGGTTFEGTDEVAKFAHLTVDKAADAAPVGGYKLGSTIHYTIKVMNDGNQPITSIKVVDTKAGFTSAEFNLNAGEEKNFDVNYTVTEDDIKTGNVENTAVVTGKDPDGDDVTGKDTENTPTEDIDTTLSVTKTSDVKAGEKASLNQVINYTIKVENKGNVAYPNVVVEDKLAGASIAAGTGYEVKDGKAVIAKLAVGAVVEVKATYKVTETDILAGHVNNVAVAKGDPIPDPNPDDPDTPNPPKTPEGEGETDDPTEDIDATLSVTKTSDVKAGEKASVNQVINYIIKVENKGNVAYPNVVVEDKLAGASITAGTGYEVKDGKAVIAKLAVGAVVEVKATYKVTETDILAGHVNNVAVAKGDPIPDPKPNPDNPNTPNPPKTPEGEGETDDPTEDIDTTLSVTKTSDVKAGEKASLNQVINYTIKVENKGNVAYPNVVVEDKLAGASIIAGTGYEVKDGKAVIAKLAAGTAVEVKAAYKVTEADILAGHVNNVATAKGDPIPNPKPNPDNPNTPNPPKTPEGEGKTEDPTEPCEPKLDVKKEVVSEAKAADGKYGLGEEITYKVTVTNTGNLTLTDIQVADVLTRPDGSQTAPSGLDAEDAVIKTLASGGTQTITYTHKVTEKDLGGKLVNAATATASNPNPKDNSKIKDTDKKTVTTKNAAASDTKKDETKKTQSVKTGDNTPIWPFVVLLAISAAALLGLLVLKKRRTVD